MMQQARYSHRMLRLALFVATAHATTSYINQNGPDNADKFNLFETRLENFLSLKLDFILYENTV